MPMSRQEIRDSADRLADWFETADRTEFNERPVGEYLLERAMRAPTDDEQRVVEAVAAAQADGMGWDRIGEILGISHQAARQRYCSAVNEPQTA